MDVTKINLSPDPPVEGQKLTVDFTANPKQDIVSGDKLNIAVELHGIKLTSIDFDLCKVSGQSCPIAKGSTINPSASYVIPDAHLSLTLTVKSSFLHGSSAFDCVTMQVTPKTMYKGFVEVDHARMLFKAWRRQFPHVDIDDEEARFNIFKHNLEKIIDHNLYGSEDYKMGANEFMHLSWEEFRSMYITGLRLPNNSSSTVPRDVHEAPVDFVAPKSVDWTKKGAVTAVKNQGQCGSCWAFSTTGSMEGAYYLKTGKLQMLSEQQLVDCDRKKDQGCNGGLMDNAFDFIHKNKGLTTEQAYPYKGTDGTCKNRVKNVPGTVVTKHTDVASNEKALMSAVLKQPVSVAIEADQMGFQFYSSGVFSGECGTNLDHGVLAVGYGTEKHSMGGNSTMPGKKNKGKNYWKVKNSWGSSWGLDGYILLERGAKQKGGQCGILNGPPSYPTL